MTVKILFTFLCLSFSISSYGGLSVYDIEKKFEAAFFSQPHLIGEVGQGEYRHRGFTSVNEQDLTVCTASYQVEETVFRESDTKEAVINYIKGQALLVNGTIANQEIIKVANDYRGTFLLTYNHQGFPARKYAAIIYHHGRFYQWAIQDIPGISKLDGRNIFYEYVKYFRVIDVENQNNKKQQPALLQEPVSEKLVSEWIPITSGLLGAVFIDLNSVKKIGKLYQVDSSVFYYDPQLLGTLKYKKSISTSQINCQEGTTSSISAQVFSDEKNSIFMDTDKIFRKPTGPNTQSEIDFICDNKLPCNETLKENNRIEIISLAGTTGYIVRDFKKGSSKIYSTHKYKPPCRESKQCDKVEGIVNRMVACGIKDSYVTNYLLMLEKSWNLCDSKYNNKCKFLGFYFWP